MNDLPRTQRLWPAIIAGGSRLRRWLIRHLVAIGFKEEHFLILLSILIGVATGLGSCAFFWLIEAITHLAYGTTGHAGGLYNGHALMLLVLPALGGLAVGWIVERFAREARGHGVPEVMDAIARQGGVIRPRVALAKSTASALTIGSGGSAGTEGPIIQIGAAIGSTFGQALQVPRREMGVLVGCGAAAGISSIFNAPIAGVLFALEIFLRDFSFRAFAPIVVASVLSASVTHSVHGRDEAIFTTQVAYEFRMTELPFYLLLGVLCALGAVAFIRLLYLIEDFFEWLRFPAVAKPALGAAALGLLGIAFVLLSGTTRMPPFYGNGYPIIKLLISNAVVGMPVLLLLALWALKLLATSFTLGSGGSGGVFAPSLFMGATLGGILGITLHALGLVAQESVPAFALVGMAATVAGTTHAPLTAIIILFEITRNYRVILPVMFAAIIATAGAQLLLRDSIYTLKLRRRGVQIGTMADLTILRRITAAEVRPLPAYTLRAEDPLQKALDLANETDAQDFIVVDDANGYRGMLVAQDVRTALLQREAVPLLVVGELMRPDVPTVHPGETLDQVMNKFARSDVNALPLTAPDDSGAIVGLITRQAVMDRYHHELQSRSE